MESFIEKFAPLIHATKYLVAPMLLSILGVVVLCLIIYNKSKKTSNLEHKALIVAFCFLGVILGVIAGGSSTPIGEALVTGVLGVITALLTYLLSKDAANPWRIFIPYAMVALLISAFVGLIVGANYKAINRTITEKSNIDEQLWIKYYEEVMIPMCLHEKEKQFDGIEPSSEYKSQCMAIKQALNN